MYLPLLLEAVERTAKLEIAEKVVNPAITERVVRTDSNNVVTIIPNLSTQGST